MRHHGVDITFLDKGERGNEILDFRSGNGQFTGSRGREEHTQQENPCWVTQKQWGTGYLAKQTADD